MIGQRVGVVVGASVGSAIGASSSEIGGGSAFSMATVARDATSNIYCPATAAQWTQVLGVAGIATGNPSAWRLLQEASGNAADSSGNGFTLTAAGTLLYQQVVAGWTRKGISTVVGVAGTLANASAGLPNIATQSMLKMSYVLTPATIATARSMSQLGFTFGVLAAAGMINGTTKKLKFLLDPNSANGVDDVSSVVRPYVIKVDRTGVVGALYSDAEKLTAALTATPSGKATQLGGDNSNSSFPDAFTYVYDVDFFLGAAELTDANVRTLLQTLGWNVLW